MLKPHIWLRPPAWPGSIDHRTDAAWAAWFAGYRAFILHYAALAQREGMDAFCIGNELQHASLREREWRELIGAVRAAYSGPITYGATAEEVTGVPFWDAVDFIGVSAYFVLTPDKTPAPAALSAAWRPVSDRLRALSARHGKRVVFTEIGYRSADFAAWRHWEITDEAPVNLRAQQNAYASFFDAVWGEEWMGGAYFWKWFSHPGHSGPDSNDFEFEGKPAAEIVAAAYRAEAAGGDVRAAVRAAAAAEQVASLAGHGIAAVCRRKRSSEQGGQRVKQLVAILKESPYPLRLSRQRQVAGLTVHHTPNPQSVGSRQVDQVQSVEGAEPHVGHQPVPGPREQLRTRRREVGAVVHLRRGADRRANALAKQRMGLNDQHPRSHQASHGRSARATPCLTHQRPWAPCASCPCAS